MNHLAAQSSEPLQENARLAALHSYGILDTSREAEFDDITEMAARACGTPISMLNLIDRDRQWFKAEVGLGIRQLPLRLSICTQALGESNILVIPDTKADPRFAANPLVEGPPHVRFYAGVPLRTPAGLPIGVLSVMDQQPRQPTAEQLFILNALARAVMARLEQRKAIAERDRALAAERRTEARSQQILNSAIDYAIISFDLEGTITSWNEGARRIMGWTEAEMRGQSAERLFTPEDVAAGRPAMEMNEALRTGHGTDERWHMRREGSRFYALGEMMVLRDDTGAITGFLKILRDRTEQRRASRALRDSQERIETALGTGLVGFFDWDVAAETIRGDACFATFYGLDTDRIATGIPLSEVAQTVHPDDRDAVTRNVAAAIAECRDYTKQLRTVSEDGRVRSILVRGRCYESDGERALRFTGIALDVSATMEAQEALRTSEAFNRQVLASSTDCIATLGLDGRIQFVSEGGQRTMEMADPNAFIGHPWSLFWKGQQAAIDALETAKRGGRAQFQGYADTAKGNRRYWDVVITPMLGADGRPERLLSISRDVSEAHAASERVELALNAGAILGTWVWDVVEDHFTADRRFASTFSLDPEILAIGMAIRDVAQSIHPEDLEHVDQLVRRAMAQGGRYRAEYRVRQPDASWRWIEANGTCELNATGAAIRFPGVLVDIDKRKHQELRQAALIAFGDQLRDLRHPAAIVCAASTILGRTLGVSRAGYGSVNEVDETITVRNDWQADPKIAPIVGRRDFRDFGSYIEDLKRNRVVAISDVTLDPRTRHNTAALESIQIRSLLNVPLMEGGQLVAVALLHATIPRVWAEEEIAFTRAVADRTWAAIEQARAAAQLLKINETLETQVASRTLERDGIWNTSQDLLGVTDAEGRWLSVNPAWSKLLGWNSEEIIGRTSQWMEHPDNWSRSYREIARASGGEQITDYQTRYRARDGRYLVFSWSVVAVEGKFYCSARDITEQQAASEDLARTQEALRQSQKMEAVGQLTGGLAHDFNNLLTGITGSLQLLSARVAQKRYQDVERYLDSAQGAAKRAAALTHRLLAFSRQQTLDPKPIDVTRLVAGMMELIKRTVGPSITVNVAAASTLWPTRVDPNQLENALLNLCINGRDATPDGGHLTIEMHNLDLDAQAAQSQDLPPGQYLTVSVTDTGAGMPPDIVAKAFDPFFTTKPIGRGTGLGLSMIYGFARQSGGRVHIHSEVGIGTTVCLYLPRYSGKFEDAQPVCELTETPRARQGETVLVVDDEPTIRLLVTEVLEELDYAIIQASDGVSGLNVLRSDVRIDLLITDVGLPGGMNGRQMAEVARAVRPDLKVLFITGYAERAVIGSGDLPPGMHVTTKPFDIDALAARVKELIQS